MPERLVRPGILTSDAVCSLGWPEEVFYRRLMSIVDDFGRYDGRASILRSQLYPLQLSKVVESDIEKWKLATAEAGLVRVYFVESKEYVQIEKFDQRLRAKSSKWPAPDGKLSSSADVCCHPHARDGEMRSSADIRNGGGDGDGREAGSETDSKYPPLLEMVNHFKKMGAPYTEDQIRRARISFEATASNGTWYIGKRPVSDWRSAIETRIDMQSQKGSGASEMDRKSEIKRIESLLSSGDPSLLEKDPQTGYSRPSAKARELQEKLKELKGL